VQVPELYLAVRLHLEPVIRTRREVLAKASHTVATPPTPQELRSATLIMLAQMALETNRFKAVMNYNLGGIKCPKGWEGCVQDFATREHWTPEELDAFRRTAPSDTRIEDAGPSETPGKRIYVIRDRFVAFESLAEAVAHHCAFFVGRWAPSKKDPAALEWKHGRYAVAIDRALENDALGFVRNLSALGYFTAPPEIYSRSVASIAREYDRTIPADPIEAPKPATPEPEAPAELVSIAASAEPGQGATNAPKPEPLAPVTPKGPQTVATAPESLPRIGEPLEVERPWWIRLLRWLFVTTARLLARRPLP
jgi:hypothetical protein